MDARAGNGLGPSPGLRNPLYLLAQMNTAMLRLLQRRYGSLPAPIIERVRGLSVPVLEALVDTILELQSETDLEQWLEERSRE